MTETITVIDSIMGAGKTSFAVQEMNRRNTEKFLYITPYKSEVQRIVDSCPGFQQPEPKRDPADPNSTPRKLHHIKQLMRQGVRGIASTHALFEDIDAEVLELAEDLGFILILDEVMEVLKQPPKLDHHRKGAGKKRSKSRVVEDEDDDDEERWNADADAGSPEDLQYRRWLDGLLRHKFLIKPDDGGSCCKLLPGEDACFPEFSHLQRYAREGRLVMVNGGLLIWQFPANCFKAFKEVWNLTYLFDGTYQKAYYDLHSLGYKRYSIVKEAGVYRPIDHSPEHDRPVIEKARTLIEVYQGAKNVVGDKTGKGHPLSHSWWKKYRGRRESGRKLMTATSELFKKKGWDVKSCKVMWTVHKKVYDSGMFPPSFKSSPPFVSMNTRATNDHRHRTALAYLVDRKFNVPVEKFFQAMNVPVSEDQFALSEMIQWVWRSAIRDGKPIKLFVPSSRMRGLLFDWFNGNLGNLHPPVRNEKYEGADEDNPKTMATA